MRTPNAKTLCALLLLALLIGPTAGCGFFAQLMYVVKGHKGEALFPGLAEKRVAVVCVSSSGAFGASSTPETLARAVEGILAKEVPGIQTIDQNDVVDWIDNNDWDRVSYKDVGRGVDAEMVVAIDLVNYSADESRMLFQGQAHYVVKVFDMTNDGMLVHKRTNEEFVFPKGGQHATGISGSKFRRLFNKVLSREIAQDFYEYDLAESVAINASYIGE